MVGASPSEGSSMITNRTVQQQGATHGEHLLLASRQLTAAIAASLGEPGEHVVDPFDRPTLATSAFREHRQVLVDGQRWEQPPTLGHIGNTVLCNLLRDLVLDSLAVGNDFTGRGLHETHERVAQRGLAHPVAADQGDSLDAHGERHTVEDTRCAVPCAQVADLEKVAAHSTLPPR